jgi:hypothetical protein
MAAPRIAQHHKIVIVVVMTMLVAAWIITGLNLGSTAEAGNLGHEGALVVPTTAIEQPASVQSIPPGIVDGGPEKALKTLSDDGIPTAALAAYRQAASLLSTADSKCHLRWTLLAAIGRVESDHGRINHSALSSRGVATPPIYGPALNGARGRPRIADTDDGIIDQDATLDRPVGPLQFVPSTWKLVAIDADGDDRRNPQDMDDAATGAAIYLCSGAGDLATEADARAALLRYNRSPDYGDLVLAIAKAYADGAFTVNTKAHAKSPSPKPTDADSQDEPSSPSSSGTTGTSTGGSTGGSTTGSTPTTAPAPKPTATTSQTTKPAYCSDILRNVLDPACH